MPIDPETLLHWSKQKLVTTSRGLRLLRTAKPTDEFRRLWASSQDKLKAAGITWPAGPANDFPEVHWWRIPGAPLKPEPEPVMQAKPQAMLPFGNAVKIFTMEVNGQGLEEALAKVQQEGGRVSMMEAVELGRWKLEIMK